MAPAAPRPRSRTAARQPRARQHDHALGGIADPARVADRVAVRAQRRGRRLDLLDPAVPEVAAVVHRRGPRAAPRSGAGRRAGGGAPGKRRPWSAQNTPSTFVSNTRRPRKAPSADVPSCSVVRAAGTAPSRDERLEQRRPLSGVNGRGVTPQWRSSWSHARRSRPCARLRHRRRRPPRRIAERALSARRHLRGAPGLVERGLAGAPAAPRCAPPRSAHSWCVARADLDAAVAHG